MGYMYRFMSSFSLDVPSMPHVGGVAVQTPSMEQVREAVPASWYPWLHKYWATAPAVVPSTVIT